MKRRACAPLTGGGVPHLHRFGLRALEHAEWMPLPIGHVRCVDVDEPGRGCVCVPLKRGKRWSKVAKGGGEMV
eukprot:1949164-Pyramimonas_sp.AAC.2